MSLPLPIPPLRLFEINDQPWFPAPVRGYVQAVLTHFWTWKSPIVQPNTPASLIAQTLQRLLGPRITDYVFVDFCSGAGGPTPSIEQEINHSHITRRKERQQRDNQLQQNGHANGSNSENYGARGVDFVLTDIHPHLAAWTAASKCSENLHFVLSPVDAANCPSDLLSRTSVPEKSKRQFRLFSLAFHHFPDIIAVRILRNTLATSDGFAILELQGRDLGNLFIVLCMWPMLLLGSWYWFWGCWGHLFFTYAVPIVPLVIVFDGLVSCLRTRREGEVMKLIREAVRGDEGGLEGWRFETGGELHTWPTGTMQYFIGIKEDSSGDSR